jgi:hypothetical protein
VASGERTEKEKQEEGDGDDEAKTDASIAI